MDMFVGKGEHIGWPFFELNKFTDIEKHHLSSCDKIISSSHWAANVVLSEIGRKSVIVPLGVDRELFPAVPVPKSKNFIVLSAGKWEKRKHDIVLKAFELAFRNDDNVELWSMNDNIVKPDENMRWQNEYKNSILRSKIKFIPRQPNIEMVASVMNTSHIGLFPSHAEGWNLELLEMMSVGRYSIATDYSAHTEYINQDNCYRVPVTELEPANDGIWFYGQGDWAKLSDTQINITANHLRTLYEKYQNGDDIFNYNGVETANKFTWDNTAKKIIENFG